MSDSTSRVISFVLGFALASLIAWLGSIRGGEVAASPEGIAVATAVTPVVADTTQETKNSKPAEPAAGSPAAEDTVVATTPAALPVAHVPVEPVPVAPAAVARTSLETGPATYLPVDRRRTATRPVAPVQQAQPQTPSPSAGSYRGALALSSSPEGAEVVVNGLVVGRTPVVLTDLPVGSRALVVRRDGYSPWSTSVRIVADQQTSVRATLTPNQ